MRYVCTSCGEAESWRECASDKVSPTTPSFGDLSDVLSETTELAGPSGPLPIFRPRDGSHSTSASRRTVHPGDDIASSPTGAIYYSGSSSGPTPPDSPRSGPADPRRGYELCTGCIETHGLMHSKEARGKRKGGQKEMGPGETRHSFREMIWSNEGWVDVGGSL